MRVLLSTIGTRGDVQPLAGLAHELRRLGAEVRLCVPPDFLPWLGELGLPAVPIGPPLRGAPAMAADQRRTLAEATVIAQFEAVSAAAEDCDVIVAASALQVAARTVAETRKIRYAFVAYCPAVLPSPHHAPAVTRPQEPGVGNEELWQREREGFAELFGAALNAHRGALGLGEVADVLAHILGERPLLAADPALAPWPGPAEAAGSTGAPAPAEAARPADASGPAGAAAVAGAAGLTGRPDFAPVLQTGAWLMPDSRPLPPELEAFLAAGEPPVYFGIGSMRAPSADVGRAMISAARLVGRRAVLSRGWAGLTAEDGPDCLVVEEVNHRALFPRVVAVVHHGGAGTTTAAALGGAPQVVLPQLYDQHFWAERVRALAIGCPHPPGTPTVESLAAALHEALDSKTVERARLLSDDMRTDGAAVAARQVLTLD